MAGPICPVAGEKDQVTGKGLIFLHHDNVPNLQDIERVVTERPPLCDSSVWAGTHSPIVSRGC